MNSLKYLAAVLLMLVIAAPLSGNQGDENNNWSQFRGPNRDGKSAETGLLKIWPENGPALLWTAEGIGEGFSSVSVSNSKIYASGIIDDVDHITAFNLEGEQIWQTSFGEGWNTSFPGVRTTPTIAGDKVYVISGMGQISCLNASDGKSVWSVDAFKIFEGEYGHWGIAENLLVMDDKVIYTPGGNKTTMVALNKNTGETKWITESLNDHTAYVSPIVIEINGKKLITNITANYFFAVNPDNGDIIWRVKYSDYTTDGLEEEGDAHINCNMPVYKDGKVFITSGYNHTAVMFDLSEDGSSINKVWREDDFDTHHGGVVEVNGYIYGTNWFNNSKGNWLCLDWETGEIMYSTKWENKGSIIYADGMLYCYEERRGNLALVEPNPKEFKVVSSFKVEAGEGPHWAHPSIQNGVLYVRHGETLSAYNIKGD